MRTKLVCSKLIDPHTHGHSKPKDGSIMVFALSWFVNRPLPAAPATGSPRATVTAIF
jgi:hypothetical protein